MSTPANTPRRLRLAFGVGGTPVLSRNWSVPDSHRLKVYESRSGYQTARKALTTLDPDKVASLVKDSELRGRGGAGVPCGLKGSFLPKDRKETS
ncbi:hypothetical protein B4Q13_21890, partial [Lacticaseibacillus rhamnosus]